MQSWWGAYQEHRRSTVVLGTRKSTAWACEHTGYWTNLVLQQGRACVRAEDERKLQPLSLEEQFSPYMAPKLPLLFAMVELKALWAVVLRTALDQVLCTKMHQILFVESVTVATDWCFAAFSTWVVCKRRDVFLLTVKNNVWSLCRALVDTEVFSLGQRSLELLEVLTSFDLVSPLYALPKSFEETSDNAKAGRAACKDQDFNPINPPWLLHLLHWVFFVCFHLLQRWLKMVTKQVLHQNCWSLAPWDLFFWEDFGLALFGRSSRCH